MGQEDGSRNTMVLLAFSAENKGVNRLREDHHCVLSLGNQQLPYHHLAETGPIVIPVGVLTMQ